MQLQQRGALSGGLRMAGAKPIHRLGQRLVNPVLHTRSARIKCRVGLDETAPRVQSLNAGLVAGGRQELSRLAYLVQQVEQLKRENEALRQKLEQQQHLQAQEAAGDNASAVAEPVSGAAGGATVLEPPDVAHKLKVAPKEYLEQLQRGVRWPAPGEMDFYKRAPRDQPMPFDIGGSDVVAPPKDLKPLQIVHITAELAPIAKVGGLGDVVTGLARTCMARGHSVSVVLPFYECLPLDQIEGLTHERDFDVPKGSLWDGHIQLSTVRTSAWYGKVGGCPVHLLRPADWNSCNLFKGDSIYGGSYNETEAYLYFCRASLEYLRASGQQPHILHIHEWQTCAVAMLYWDVYNKQGLFKARLVLTIHNMDNTGECRQDEFIYTGTSGAPYAKIDRALDERTIGHNPERLNLMKGGIIYSNAVTTVSPTYADEVLSGGAAGWLRATLSKPEVKGKVRGILNGIDTHDWDPSTDPLLPANYNSQFPDGKRICKHFLQQGLGLTVDATKPLVVVVSRLVPQKGIHLMKAAVYRTLEKGGQFVLLGSGHSDGVFRAMASSEFASHPDVKLLVMYSEQLAHQMYGAADFVLVPSMFEPCGLTQMIAMRYGSVPVVRRTGGLADTVRDVDSYPLGEANGYTFAGTDEQSLYQALDRALDHYTQRPDMFLDLSLANMNIDVSWNRSAGDYINLYNTIVSP